MNGTPDSPLATGIRRRKTATAQAPSSAANPSPARNATSHDEIEVFDCRPQARATQTTPRIVLLEALQDPHQAAATPAQNTPLPAAADHIEETGSMWKKVAAVTILCMLAVAGLAALMPVRGAAPRTTGAPPRTKKPTPKASRPKDTDNLKYTRRDGTNVYRHGLSNFRGERVRQPR